MNLARFALRNTRRHPRRSLLTALAIALAVAAATVFDAYMAGALDAFFDAFIRLEAGHVKVMPAAAVDRARRLPLDDGLTNVDSLTEVIRSVDGVERASARVRFGVLLEGEDGAVPALGTAVTPSRERGLLELDEWVVDGRVPADGAGEALVGDRLADAIGLAIGDELFFVTSTSYGGLGPGLYTITGLFHSGIADLDKRGFFVPLAPAQYQLAMEDRALEIVVTVTGGMDGAAGVANQIQRAIDGAGFDNVRAVPWQAQGYLYEMMAPARFFSLIMMGLLGVIALTTVANTVLMSVMERTREIGSLRALGVFRGTITRMILLESVLVGVLGTAVGLAVGMGVSLWLNRVGIDLTSVLDDFSIPINPIIYPDPDLSTALRVSLFGLIVAVIAAWYPARVATRLQPARALRAE